MRNASIERKTNETEVKLNLILDGKGTNNIDTKIPFLDHMLDLWTKHSNVDLSVQASGDIDIDLHHTVEDIGICLGQAIKKSLGDKKGIKRVYKFTLKGKLVEILVTPIPLHFKVIRNKLFFGKTRENVYILRKAAK